MEYFFSFLERKSFIKIFSISLISFFLLTGFIFSDEQEQNIVSTFPPKKIDLIYGTQEKPILAYGNDIGEVLENHEIEYSENDIIFPSLDFEIKGTNFIKVTMVNKEVFREIVEIPFENERIVDQNLTSGQEVLVQKGEIGWKEITYKNIYKNDQFVETIVHEVKILEEPKNTIVKTPPGTSAMGGRNCPHWFSIVDKVTQDDNEREILKSLIKCESHCNDAKNNRDTYLGLLQFSRSTFLKYGGTDIWSGQQQINAALNILRAGGLSHHWPACSRRLN